MITGSGQDHGRARSTTTTAQDVITVKPERSFDALDADRDGCLEWADYQTWTRTG
ncbi:hypothetical protein [Streptomyces sp. NPDC005435]|uniref:hypothetical protein n=1 Tax=Streptomyces sp. NPDC005435 TaxID=3154464 RepID=UPI0034521486